MNYLLKQANVDSIHAKSIVGVVIYNLKDLLDFWQRVLDFWQMTHKYIEKVKVLLYTKVGRPKT